MHTYGTIYTYVFWINTGGTIQYVCVECDTGGTFHRGLPALWNFFIFTQNYIQTISNWSAKKNIEKTYSF